MEFDLCQPVTVIECFISDMGDIRRNLNGLQTVAAITESVGDAGPAGWNIDMPEISAILEHIAIHLRQTLRNMSLFDSIAILKHPIIHLRQSFRQIDLSQRMVGIECISANGTQRAGKVDIIHRVAAMKR